MNTVSKIAFRMVTWKNDYGWIEMTDSCMDVEKKEKKAKVIGKVII